MTDRLLRLRAAGKRLGDIKAKTVREWIRRGKILGVRLPNGHWRVTEQEVDRCLENKTYRNRL